MFEGLDEISVAYAKEILMSFPEWQKFCSIIEDDGDTAFCIRVKSPSQNYDHELVVDTFREEITVSFDAYHAHYYDFKNEEHDDAFTLINHILSDEFAVVSYWRDDKWCASSLVEKEFLPENNEEYPYANTIKVVSWSGTLDCEIACVSRD